MTPLKIKWRPLGDSNPCYRRERAMSWATRRRGRKSLQEKSGGARRDRTADLYNAIVALSQLSYGPTTGTFPSPRQTTSRPGEDGAHSRNLDRHCQPTETKRLFQLFQKRRESRDCKWNCLVGCHSISLITRKNDHVPNRQAAIPGSSN